MPGKIEGLTIQVPEPTIQTLKLKVVGTATLIHKKWDDKAIEMIEAKQRKEALKPKSKREPQQEFEDSLYVYKKGKFSYEKGSYPIDVKFTGVIGIPATWIKQAVVEAVRNVDGLTMTLVRGAVFVKADENGLIPVDAKKLRMRRDMVRIGQGVADVRYRGELVDWSANIEVVVNADVMSAEQVINLLKIAGFACGIGEWRPQRNGDHGTFSVEGTK